MSGETFYQLLGLDRSASSEQIKEAYREIARVYHPDSNFYDEIVPEAAPDPRVIERFQRITEAYNTLSNERRRKEYDLTLPLEAPNWEANIATVEPSSELHTGASSAFQSSGSFGIFGRVDRAAPISPNELRSQQAEEDDEIKFPRIRARLTLLDRLKLILGFEI